LEDALRAFDRVEALIHPGQLKMRAADFSEAVFDRRFRAVVNRRSGEAPKNARAAPIVTLTEGASEKFHPWIQEGRRGWHLPVGEQGE